MAPHCPRCDVKYGVFGSANVPVVQPCLCRMCKKCLSQQEAEAKQQAAASASASGVGGKKKTKGKGKAKKKEEQPVYNGMQCKICNKLCNATVSELPLDIALMKELSLGGGGSAAAAAAPLCDHCEEEQATQCCAQSKISCDGCFSFTQKSTTKQQGHVGNAKSSCVGTYP